MRWLAILLMTQPAWADSLVATRTLRAGTLVGPDDLTLVSAALDGALTDPTQAIGRETRVAIYAGKPVMAADLGPPTLIERNQLVTLVFRSGGLAISTEGRALDRGAEGDLIKVMNLGSRTTVTGRIGPDSTILVGWDD